MPWLTPENTADITCVQLYLPDSEELRAAFWGAFLDLTEPSNWEEFGAQTPQDMADLFDLCYVQSVQLTPCSEGGCMANPVGTVIWGAWDTAPDGTLLCDGSQYSTSVYPELFAEIGYTWGGSGTVFNVPNLVNRSCIGAGDSYALGDYAGEAQHTLTLDETAPHHHGLYPSQASGATVPVMTPNGKSLGATVLTTDSGGGQPHNNVHPVTALTPAIVYTTG